MKKMIAVVFAALMILTLTAASAEPLMGGWNLSDSIEVTEEQLDLFNRALDGLVGVTYEPVAYLGYQVVAGMNHCFLCRATVVYPGAVPSYKLVYIYSNLEGNAEITGIADLDLAALLPEAAQE